MNEETYGLDDSSILSILFWFKTIYSLKNPGTDMNQVFVSELKSLLGEDNVKIVNKAKEVRV